ncbi:hypothetical protein [Candidatus Nitrososphaera evergladensis]|nr:hypothetical protein [Candidatus Nitrososphaera evergladensis]
MSSSESPAGSATCTCPCHKKYGDRSYCNKCIDHHKTSPHYQVLKKFE